MIVKEKIMICSIAGNTKIPEEKKEYIISELKEEVKRAISDGYLNFRCGFAQGLDLLFADIVVKEIETNPNIKLQAVLPYFDRLKSPNEEFQRLIKYCSDIKIISREPTLDCFYLRDKWIIDNADRIIITFNNSNLEGQSAIAFAKVKEKDITLIPIN